MRVEKRVLNDALRRQESRLALKPPRFECSSRFSGGL